MDYRGTEMRWNISMEIDCFKPRMNPPTLLETGIILT